MTPKTLLAAIVMLALGWVNVTSQTAPPSRPVPKILRNEIDAEGFYGELEKNTYNNEFLGFSFSFPEEYTVLNRAEIDLYSNAGKDLVKSGVDRKTARFDEGLARTATLIALVEKAPGSPGNAAMEIGVVKQNKGVTANLVLLASVKALQETSKYTLTETFPTIRYNGRDFAAVEFETTAFIVPMTQRFFVTMQREYSVMICITYQNEAGLRAFEKVLDTIKFQSK